MAYCTTDHVQEEFKDQTFTTSTKVTLADVTRFILESDALINSKLGLKYQTPITGTNALILMRMISVWLTKSRILDIFAVKTGRTETDQDGGTETAAKANKLLQDIVDGAVALSDATLLSSDYRISSYSLEHDLENVFEKGVDQ